MNDTVTYMTSEELAACCEALSWGPTALARATGIREITISRWFKAERHIPPPIADHIRLLAALHRANPFPDPGPHHEQAIGRADNPSDVQSAAGGVRPHSG
jgi:hypothetical protein